MKTIQGLSILSLLLLFCVSCKKEQAIEQPPSYYVQIGDNPITAFNNISNNYCSMHFGKQSGGCSELTLSVSDESYFVSILLPPDYTNGGDTLRIEDHYSCGQYHGPMITVEILNADSSEYYTSIAGILITEMLSDTLAVSFKDVLFKDMNAHTSNAVISGRIFCAQ